MKRRPPPIPDLSEAPRRKRGLSAEERALWENVAKQIKPLRKKFRALKNQAAAGSEVATVPVPMLRPGAPLQNLTWSERPHDSDARDQRDDPAEDRGVAVVSRYQCRVSRRRQHLHRMQDQEQANRPVRNPARVIEHDREHDEIAGAHHA